MAKKSQEFAAPDPSLRPAAKQRGRLPSEEAGKFAWYRGVEGFEKSQWWRGINWTKNVAASVKAGENTRVKASDATKAKKLRRSIQHPKSTPRDLLCEALLPGFLWEAIRRLPEFPTLMEKYRRLSGSECDESLPSSARLISLAHRQQASTGFLDENGILVLPALEVLNKEWKLSFENLPQESKNQWEVSYLALWNKVGEPGSVPAVPAELPGTGPERFFGQGRTAFDLLPKLDFIYH